MRRTDREITNTAEILDIISHCEVLRLALCDDNKPYIVPMNFGYEYTADGLTIWLHCANEGKKLDLLRRNPNAAFELDCSYETQEAEEACEYSAAYESVCGSGTLHICENPDEKRAGLLHIMRQYAPEREFTIPDTMLARVTVLRLSAFEFTGKRNTRKFL